MLSKSGESGHRCLVPDAFAFLHFFTIENNICYELIIYGLYYIEVGFIYAQLDGSEFD